MFNIEDFCSDKTDQREKLRQPCNAYGFDIATNGFVLIFGPGSDKYQKYDGGLNIEIYIDDHLKANYQPTTYILPSKIQCQACYGEKNATVETCYECNGDGVIEFSSKYNFYECDCDTCGGDGELIKPGGDKSCIQCSGQGEHYRLNATVNILGVFVSAKYLALVDHPDTQFAANLTKQFLLFKNKTQFGVIAGMRY